jgi:hypothetical protein
MSHPHATHSHPICPTCQSDLTGEETLERFAGEGNSPTANDDVCNLHEETLTLLHFLGAVAQASPLAVTKYTENMASVPGWIDDLRRLAEELTGETKRRLELLYRASALWEERAKGKEG